MAGRLESSWRDEGNLRLAALREDSSRGRATSEPKMPSAIKRVPVPTSFLVGCILACSLVTAAGLKSRPEQSGHLPLTRARGGSLSPESDPFTSTTVGGRHPEEVRGGGQLLVCLYGAYAAYRDGDGHFTTDKIDAHLCTHVVHGTFGLTENNTIQSAHPHLDFDEDEGSLGLLKQLAELKRANPNLKTLVSIGGSEVTSGEFSTMAAQPESRQRFAASVVEFLAKHQLDGVDINWQFPGAFTGDAEADKAAFVELLADLRAALEPHNYLLSAQVAAAYKLIKMGYDIRKVSEPLDLILLMAYDYNETRDNRTSLIAPLYAPRRDRLDKDNVNWSVNHWLRGGAPAEKLILGVTSYALTFTLDSARSTGVGAPAGEPGAEGEHTKMQGLLGYNELCESLGNERGAWKVRLDAERQAVFAVNGLQWVSYEDRRSLATKTRFALTRGLGGVALYSLDADDFLGRCHAAPFPLARRVREVLALAANDPASERE